MACLVGLNPMMIRKGRERSTRSASANLGREVRGARPRIEHARHSCRCAYRNLFRVVLWEETGLQNRLAGFDSLTARQIIQVWVAGIPAAL